jgi:hypothetical protein
MEFILVRRLPPPPVGTFSPSASVVLALFLLLFGAFVAGPACLPDLGDSPASTEPRASTIGTGTSGGSREYTAFDPRLVLCPISITIVDDDADADADEAEAERGGAGRLIAVDLVFGDADFARDPRCRDPGAVDGDVEGTARGDGDTEILPRLINLCSNALAVSFRLPRLMPVSTASTDLMVGCGGAIFNLV